MIQFHTNIDCAKRFVNNLPTFLNLFEDAQFLVGDRIEVYKETNTSVEMKVVGRTWTTGKHGPILNIELGLGSQFLNYTQMENFLKSSGLPVY